MAKQWYALTKSTAITTNDITVSQRQIISYDPCKELIQRSFDFHKSTVVRHMYNPKYLAWSNGADQFFFKYQYSPDVVITFSFRIEVWDEITKAAVEFFNTNGLINDTPSISG